MLVPCLNRVRMLPPAFPITHYHMAIVAIVMKDIQVTIVRMTNEFAQKILVGKTSFHR